MVDLSLDNFFVLLLRPGIEEVVVCEEFESATVDSDFRITALLYLPVKLAQICDIAFLLVYNALVNQLVSNVAIKTTIRTLRLMMILTLESCLVLNRDTFSLVSTDFDS